MKISRGGFATRIPFAKKKLHLFCQKTPRMVVRWGLLAAGGGQKIGRRVVTWPKFRCLRRYSCRTGVAGNLDLVRLWAVGPQLRPRKPRARNLAYPWTIDTPSRLTGVMVTVRVANFALGVWGESPSGVRGRAPRRNFEAQRPVLA